MFSKLIAILALTAVGAAHAQNAPLTLDDFEFAPPAEVFISTDPLDFSDNEVLQVGGLNATFGAQSMVVYSLERAYGNPVGPTEYTAFTSVPTSVGQLFSVAGTPTTNVQSGAIQLAIWQLTGTMNFEVVDDFDGAYALSQTWISQISSQTPVASLTSLQNKSYNYFVTTTAPIPEPGTLGMMFAGLGVGAFFLRRKGKRA